ncbi:MAG: glycosyl hydrolase [Pedobacter sp.]|nr:glycosyl hydrolase [Pedobacter sp.]MDQ8051665.1 glycosyl hydrolase [Pedobacter sp.]
METSRRKFIKISSIAAANLPLVKLEGKAAVLIGDQSAASSTLETNFYAPPQYSKSACYWWWFNARVDHEGITRDLEEFRKKGISEVVMINSSGGLSGVPYPAGVPFLSDAWKELYRFAMKEAKRIGIEVGINLCSGWSMGGPWIKPENASRWYLQSKLEVDGPKQLNEALPLPNPRDRYDHVFNPPGFKDYIDLPLDQLDYQDTAVVAFQLTDPQHNQILDGRANVLPAKNNHRDATSWSRASDSVGGTIFPWQNLPADRPIPVSKVIDLSDKVKNGHLTWEVPAGKWVIVRTGHRMTGSKVMVAQPEGDGLSVDWFDHKGVDIQFKNLGKVFLEEAAKVGNKPKYFCDDSFEDGFPNWTANILNYFKQYRGYDATPYLPALMGYNIGSAEISDRFMHDYRKTLGDCMAEQHYKHFADLCHANGLKMQNESAGPSRSSTVSIDGLKNLGRSDFPMGEFWLGISHDKEGGLSEELSFGTTRIVGGADGQNINTKMVASASHIYGKATASAEAFTSYRHWSDAPGNLKQALDRAFCEGINRIALHTSTASRPSDGKPGYEYGAGTHFNPNVTWWEKSNAFFDYVARCQYLLRSGKFHADVLYYNGDNVPNLVDVKKIHPDLGSGYDYDVCNEEVLLTRLSVKNGKIVLPDGMSYRILVLPNTERMPVAVLKKLKQLVSSGATVVGPRPIMDSGLKNYPICDQEIRKLAAELWGKVDGRATKLNHYGAGRVFMGVSTRNILLNDGIEPDFRFSGKENFIDFIHRTTAGAEIYFLTNRHRETVETTATFRCRGRKPELWDAVTGSMMKAPQYRETAKGTSLALAFEGFQSVFVVFPKNSGKTVLSKNEFLFQNKDTLTPLKTLTGPWEVQFDPKWGGPASVNFDTLLDWSKSGDERIKFYAGKAKYLKTFDYGSLPAQQQVFLNLGVVKDIASVKLNGKDLGIIWTKPWQVELTKYLKQTDNLLEIEVINQWPNRLIGDAALPVEQRLTNTNIVFKKTDPLLPSGLIGPVTLLVHKD